MYIEKIGIKDFIKLVSIDSTTVAGAALALEGDWAIRGK